MSREKKKKVRVSIGIGLTRSERNGNSRIIRSHYPRTNFAPSVLQFPSLLPFFYCSFFFMFRVTLTLSGIKFFLIFLLTFFSHTRHIVDAYTEPDSRYISAPHLGLTSVLNLVCSSFLLFSPSCAFSLSHPVPEFCGIIVHNATPTLSSPIPHPHSFRRIPPLSSPALIFWTTPYSRSRIYATARGLKN
jgi:hypothetical protein